MANWTGEVCSLLRLSTYPTAPQADLLAALIEIVIEKTLALEAKDNDVRSNANSVFPTFPSAF